MEHFKISKLWNDPTVYTVLISNLYDYTHTANISLQDVPRTSPSNVPRTSPKDPIWLSRGRPNLTSWGRPEMTSRGRLNLTFKGRLWEVDSGRPQDVPWRTLRVLKLGCLNSFFNFSFRTYSMTKSKSISTLKLYWEPSKTSKMEHFLQN